jgi:hypothetical protein
MKIFPKRLIQFIFLVILFAVLAPAQLANAQTETSPADDVHVLIEPVIGYQSLQRTYPFDHKQGMLTYGLRVVVGTYRLAGEGEFQYGSATENFSNPTVTDNTSFIQARVGARTIVPVIEQLSLIFRLGMEGFHYSNEISNATTTITDSPAWKFEPYLGAGVNFFLFKSLSLSVEEVYVIDTSWETSFGFRLYI